MSRNRKVVGLTLRMGIFRVGQRQLRVKGILSRETAELRRPWRPLCCRKHHQL